MLILISGEKLRPVKIVLVGEYFFFFSLAWPKIRTGIHSKPIRTIMNTIRNFCQIGLYKNIIYNSRIVYFDLAIYSQTCLFTSTNDLWSWVFEDIKFNKIIK